MNFKSLALAATLVVASATAFATPQYNGNTSGSSVIPGNSTSLDAGYYLWNDTVNTNSWYLRWTGNNAGGNANLANSSQPTWAGSIFFRNGNLGTSSVFSFENTQDTMNAGTVAGADFIQWTSLTNNSGGVDGINFTIDGTTELLALSLGSSLFANLALESSDPGVTSEAIFIGSGFDSTNALVVKRNGMVYQEFEITVSEPATLALLGLGLVGLGFARRKQAKA